MTIDYQALIRMMDDATRRIYDACIVPSEFMQERERSTADALTAAWNTIAGMRVIESPLAVIRKSVPHRLRRSRTFPYRGYEIAYKEVAQPAAFLIDTRRLFDLTMKLGSSRDIQR